MLDWLLHVAGASGAGAEGQCGTLCTLYPVIPMESEPNTCWQKTKQQSLHGLLDLPQIVMSNGTVNSIPAFQRLKGSVAG